MKKTLLNLLLGSLAIEWAVTFIQELWKDMPKQVTMGCALILSLLACFTVPGILQDLPFTSTIFGKVVYAFIMAGGSRAVREFLKAIRLGA